MTTQSFNSFWRINDKTLLQLLHKELLLQIKLNQLLVLLVLVLDKLLLNKLLLLQLLARRSELGAWLAARGIEVVFTWKGVLLATMVMSFPLLVRSARTAFEEVEPPSMPMTARTT